MLDAATACFLERGFGGTSMRDVAERCGILSGSLYHHVSSKEELLAAVLEEIVGILEINVARVERYESAGSGGLALLRNLVYSNIAGCVMYPAQSTVFFHELDEMVENRMVGVVGWSERHDAVVRRCLEQGIERGEIRSELNSDIVCSLIISMYGSLRRYPDRSDGGQDRAELYADLLVHSLAR